MKRIISFVLVFLMLVTLLVGCNNVEPPKESEMGGEGTPAETPAETPVPEKLITLSEGIKCTYTVVRPQVADDNVIEAAKAIRNALVDAGAKDASIKEDFLLGDAKPAQYEILVGMTNREESARALEGSKYDDYCVTVDGDKIVVNSYNSEQLLKAAEHFAASLNAGENVTFAESGIMRHKAEYAMDDITVDGRSLMGYRIVHDVSAPALVKNLIVEFQKEVIRLSGIYLPIVGDTREAVEKELLFGNTRHLAVPVGALGQYGYEIKTAGDKIVIATYDNDFTFVKTMEMIMNELENGSLELVKGKLDVSDAPILTSMCFSDVHNNFAMLQENNSSGDYVVRRNVDWMIDHLLETEGEVDVVMVGGDYMSDYPSWNTSGRLPYKYYQGFKAKTIETFNRLAKDDKVMYAAGNHDYAQGESSGLRGPGKNGSYNSFDFYFDGPMDETLGVLADGDKFVKTSTHTEMEYLLGYYYNVNGIHFIGFSPDPDMIWSEQGYGFSKEQLKWLDEKLDEIDPKGTEVIFVNCHYALSQRVTSTALNNVYTDNTVTADFVPVLSGHKNLFYMFGHWHTFNSYHKDTTVKNVLHYKEDGKVMPIKGSETESTEVAGSANRSFTCVWMGGFRLDWSDGTTVNSDKFNDDYVTGIYTHESTGTPRMAQGMYIEVYPDRVVFQMKNVGDYPEFSTEDILQPYTVYLYK